MKACRSFSPCSSQGKPAQEEAGQETSTERLVIGWNQNTPAA